MEPCLTFLAFDHTSEVRTGLKPWDLWFLRFRPGSNIDPGANELVKGESALPESMRSPQLLLAASLVDETWQRAVYNPPEAFEAWRGEYATTLGALVRTLQSMGVQ